MGQLWLFKHDKPVLVLFTQHHINTAFILWILPTSILSHFSPSICFLSCFSLPSLGLVTCFPHLELLLLWQTHSQCNTQGWKAESLPTKIWYKTRMFTLTTSLHHSIGSPRHSNQTRRRNKKYPNWTGRGKTVTLCKWNHRTASVVSLCICDSHSPSCLFFSDQSCYRPSCGRPVSLPRGVWDLLTECFPFPHLLSPPHQHFLFCFASYSHWRKEAPLAAAFPCPVQREATPSFPLTPAASFPQSPMIARLRRHQKWSPELEMTYCKIQPPLSTALVREPGGRGVCFTSFLPGILLLQGHVLSVPVAPSFLFTLCLFLLF